MTVAGAEVTTDADGAFTIADVPAGRIDVFVLADGYEPLLITRGR